MTSSIKTAVIIGGTSGLGLEFAGHLHKLGKKVIVTGRPNSKNLAEIAKSEPALQGYGMDVSDLASLPGHLEHLFTQHPDLNSVWINAGIQHTADVKQADADGDAKLIQEINVNLTALIILTRYAIQHLLKLPEQGKGSTIFLTSSGLGFLPNKIFSVYCATKAAVHAYAVAARQALEDTNISLVEIVPPYVKGTQLGVVWPDPSKALPGLTLEEYTHETFGYLDSTPAEELKEVAAGSAKTRVQAWRSAIGPLLAQIGSSG